MIFSYTGTPYTGISWDFGDGSPAATIPKPVHTFSTAGDYTVCVTVSNACGSNTYCSLVNTSGGSNIGYLSAFADLHIYPNPATQVLNIDHAAAGTILEVYNVMGARIIVAKLKGNNESINVNNLASGVYLLQLTDGEGKRSSARFVKQ